MKFGIHRAKIVRATNNRYWLVVCLECDPLSPLPFGPDRKQDADAWLAAHTASELPLLNELDEGL